MKRLLFIACFLFCCISVNAKTDELTGEILRRVPAFTTGILVSWVDSINSGKAKPASQKKSWRVEIDSSQLIGGYWEITLSFWVKTKNSNEKHNTVFLQTKSNEVISAVVDNGEIFERREVLYDSTSPERWTGLSDAWKTGYGVGLEKSAFLYPTDAYGVACGYVAIAPIRRNIMMDYVAKRDVAALTSWLQSPIPDKQCYAVEGFFLLKKAGLTLTEEQLSMIREAQKRQALVTRCAGCIYGLERQDIILGGFRF